MSELLSVDTSALPTARTMTFRNHSNGGVCLVVDLPTIADARAWALAFGVRLKDTDPDCHFIHVRQEAGVLDCGPLRIHLVGTEATPVDEMDARKVIQLATRATRAAVIR